ncbi:MAG: tryptophan--tRNA ligase [Candidatus Nanoarchaeia archaeon]|nr:tryptophan--tRNA ligase [Candidatus Nanoarchaeia archaeon]
MTVLIDPWGSSLIEDYEKLLKQFGLDSFSPSHLPDPDRLMRRGVIFASQDLRIIADCIKNKKPYYALTGIMPTSDKIHFGNKMVVETMKYFQDHGAKTYVLVADLEAAATRGITIEEAQKRAKEFHIPAYLALGLDPKKTIFYFQSLNDDVTKIAFQASRKITANEFRATYGSYEPSRILSALTQIGDMLLPQEVKKMPGIIPVGMDQAPHIRLCRDYIRRSKKYQLISSIYNKFTPSLDGGFKMSKSKPESALDLPESDEIIIKRLMKAKTGGRQTLEEHRRLGGEPEKCMIFELLKQHLIEDDKELKKVYNAYKSGKMTSMEIKQLGIEKMTEFMHDFEKKLKKAQKVKVKFYKNRN